MVWSFLKETIGIYWLFVNSLLCLIIYQFIFKNWNFFTKKNVKFVRGLPLLGSQYKTMLGQESFFDAFKRLYELFPNEKIFGIFGASGQPQYIVRDPELIKQISIKDFDHFINHTLDIHEDSDPMFGRSLFMMKDQRWKDMRSTLSPAFTGSKMRSMFALISEVSKTFYMNYFRRIILDNISYREKNNIVRNDMINILIETKKEMLTAASDDQDTDAGFATIKDASDRNLGNTVTKWTDDDLVAQSMIFFLAGFGTVSLTMAFATHELVVNPDVQENLYQEIVEIQEKLDGRPLSYEALQKMKYMDMVLSETMRLWPQSPANDRLVNKPYIVESSKGNKFQLNVGDMIWIPVSGVHMDPKFFPNPTKFDPDRFSDENKDKIVSGTYMPFGIGPRSCIASRFAIMECKAFLFHLLANFKLERSSKTQDPLKLKATGTVTALNGYWMRLRTRS